MSLPVTYQDVTAAAERIAGSVERTPSTHSRTLSQVLGCTVVVKFENLQFVACLLYTSPSPRDRQKSRMPSSA